jgi:anaerobic magnesium-protoporphyrin IX monomethyl ester cyclase
VTSVPISDFRVALVRGGLVAPQGSLNNEPTPAIGLAYIAGSLRHAGFPVVGIDATAEDMDRVVPIAGTRLQYNGIGVEAIIDRLPADTRVVGVTAMFSHEWTVCRSLIQALKAARPEAVIVAGGEHATALPEYVLRDCHALDYIVMGEGEETMVELCRTLASGENPRTLAGISYLDGERFVKAAPRARIRNVNDIPWPDWTILPIEPYLQRFIGFGASFGRNMPLMVSRGCPYQCTFCSSPEMWTTRYYIRSADDVIREIKRYISRYNITGLQFYDLTAIIRKEWTVEFCKKMIDAGIELEWSLPSGTRSEALDEESLALLARSHCRYLVYAPESGSPQTLKLIKKHVRLDRMKQSIRTAIRNGITVRTNLIIGFPHETRRNIYESLKLLLEFAWMGVDECPLYPFQPYPGSALFEYLRSTGRLTLNDDYFEMLATLSTGKFALPPQSFCEYVGRREIHMYRILGFIVFYTLSYLFKPLRIFQTINNVFFTNKSNTVFEQRLKDRLRRRLRSDAA